MNDQLWPADSCPDDFRRIEAVTETAAPPKAVMVLDAPPADLTGVHSAVSS